jgi:Xaa-Pro aminopeptidase
LTGQQEKEEFVMGLARANRLIHSMALGKRHGVVLHNPSNIFYISGYTGEGALLIAPDRYAIITDFRYTEQARGQSPDFEVHMIEKSVTHEEIAGALCASWGIEKVYFEEGYLTVQAFKKWREAAKGVEWAHAEEVAESLRVTKDEGELALIDKACKITGEAFERILPQIREGTTEKQLALTLEFDMRRNGADAPAFSTIVAAGANGSLPHAIPSDYAFRRGDMITLDFGAKVGGYSSDMTRTVALGEPGAEMRKVYQIVKEAQQMAQDAVSDGASCKAIDAVARDYIYAKGYEGRFGHGLGHGLGIDIHESPRFNAQSAAVLKKNQVMTVEPGIYLPGTGGVRIENTVVVTEDGCRALTLPTRELIILP